MAGRPRRSFRSRLAGKRFPLSYAPAIIVPIASILGGGGSGSGQQHGGLIDAFSKGDMSYAMKEARNIIPYELVGYSWDGHFDMGIWARNIGLILGGFGMHKVANYTGLNRYMAKIPMIGKYLSI